MFVDGVGKLVGVNTGGLLLIRYGWWLVGKASDQCCRRGEPKLLVRRMAQFRPGVTFFGP